MVDEDGSGLERITYSDGFDGFPVFSPDGRYLMWGSNRDQGEEGETRRTYLFVQIIRMDYRAP